MRSLSIAIAAPRTVSAAAFPGLTRSEASGYLRCVQAGTLKFNYFKVAAALQIVGDGTTVAQFQTLLSAARRVEHGRPGFVLCTPTGAGRGR